MPDCVNWWRVIANGGVSFCTAAIAALGTGLAEPTVIKVAIIVALLQGGLAFFMELKKETEGFKGQISPISNVVLI